MNYEQLRADVRGALSVTECEVLGDWAAATEATAALEVGHYLGLSTCVLLDSLPEACSLVTIDHHNGDDNCGATAPSAFSANVQPFIRERRFVNLRLDMREAITSLLGNEAFGFIFYDADHTEQGVRDFWDRARYLAADDCTLIFDDADWESQAILAELAALDGFVVVRDRAFWRCETADKANPDTYTLEVMRRRG